MDHTLLLIVLSFTFVGVIAKDFDVTKDVTFRLFSSNNKYEYENLGFDVDNITLAGFDFNKDTKFVTHGFLNNGSGMSCIAVRDAYLKHHDVNLIIVDYKPISTDLIWTLPNKKIELVGEYVATFLDFLIESGYDAIKIHLIGHSLGAHVMGNAARHTQGGKIVRVTGLDPALMGDSDVRLTDDVAEFVDIIHTCRGVYGMISSLGTADFYPNGGVAIQPNCGILGGVTCSHYEAVWFMAKSIEDPKRYPALSCDSENDFDHGKCDDNEVAYMGIDAAPSARGDYYLTTTKDEE